MARGRPWRIARRDADLMEAAGPRGTGAEGVSPVPALYGGAINPPTARGAPTGTVE